MFIDIWQKKIIQGGAIVSIFDKLFGRNKSVPQKPNISPEIQRTIDEANKAVQDLLNSNKEEAEINRNKVLHDIRERSLKACAKVPGSEKYVLDVRQEESHAETLNITDFFPIDNKQFVVFDLETTGINYTNYIVEIGAVRVVNGEIVEEYSQLVKPGHPIPAEASAVNHITDDMVEGKPSIQEVLPSFLSFIGDDVLVAHNVRFDYSFLANACMLHFFKIPEVLFDTMTLARYYPEAGSKKLTDLVKAAGIEMETAHRALSDARMTAKLVIATNEKRKKKK